MGVNMGIDLVPFLKRRAVFLVWVLLCAGTVTVGFWGLRSEHFWRYWEIAALASTFLYTIVFYATAFFYPPYLFKDLKENYDIGIAVIFLGLGLLSLAAATFLSIVVGDYRYLLVYLCLSGLWFCGLDAMMVYRTKDGTTSGASFKDSLSYSDLPVTIAFLLLSVYAVLIYPTDEAKELRLRAFFGGAIAFQMIVSNWVYAKLFYDVPAVQLPDLQVASKNGG